MFEAEYNFINKKGSLNVILKYLEVKVEKEKILKLGSRLSFSLKDRWLIYDIDGILRILMNHIHGR